MAKIIMIAALGKKGEIGLNNKLIWPIKKDLKFFKEMTMGHKIVMGYKTFCSLPGLLKGREHIVLTHKNLDIEGVKIFNSFDELTNYLKSLNEYVYIIGGASIYKLFLGEADELLLTEIDRECDMADAYFPEFDKNNYDREIIREDREETIDFCHVRYRKREKL